MWTLNIVSNVQILTQISFVLAEAIYQLTEPRWRMMGKKSPFIAVNKDDDDQFAADDDNESLSMWQCSQ